MPLFKGSIVQPCSSLTDCFLERRQLCEKFFAEGIKSLGVFFVNVIPPLDQLHAGHRFEQ